MKKDVSFLSADGKTKIHTVMWLPDDSTPVAVIQLIHGMLEYIDRYEEFAQYMTENGFAVVGHDHLGHGDSVNSPDAYGYIADCADPANILVRDIHHVRCAAMKHFPKLPYFILGHSMGSYLLRMYLSQHGEGLDGAIIMGTGQQPDFMTNFGLSLIKLKSKIKGDRTAAPEIRDLSYNAYYKKFDLFGENPENSWLSKNVDDVISYYKDPKCTFIFSYNAYKALLSAVKYDNQPKNIDRIPKNLPLLLISGSDDPVGDCGKAVKAVYSRYVKAGITDITCNLIEGDRHEILREPDRADTFEYILDWITLHVAKQHCE